MIGFYKILLNKHLVLSHPLSTYNKKILTTTTTITITTTTTISYSDYSNRPLWSLHKLLRCQIQGTLPSISKPTLARQAGLVRSLSFQLKYLYICRAPSSRRTFGRLPERLHYITPFSANISFTKNYGLVVISTI